MNERIEFKKVYKENIPNVYDSNCINEIDTKYYSYPSTEETKLEKQFNDVCEKINEIVRKNEKIPLDKLGIQPAYTVFIATGVLLYICIVNFGVVLSLLMFFLGFC